MFKQSLIAIGLVAALGACSTTTTNPNVVTNAASERASIDADSNAALTKLYAQAPGSRELASKARGVLVFPKVVGGGLIIGGSYGRGQLIVNGRPDSYYSTASLSAGLLAGAESRAIYLFFMNDESLAKFRASKGWTVGADASVSVITAGANAGVDTNTIRQPIVGYVLTNAGLMANLSIDGTKITPLAL